MIIIQQQEFSISYIRSLKQLCLTEPETRWYKKKDIIPIWLLLAWTAEEWTQQWKQESCISVAQIIAFCTSEEPQRLQDYTKLTAVTFPELALATNMAGSLVPSSRIELWGNRYFPCLPLSLFWQQEQCWGWNTKPWLVCTQKSLSPRCLCNTNIRKKHRYLQREFINKMQIHLLSKLLILSFQLWLLLQKAPLHIHYFPAATS